MPRVTVRCMPRVLGGEGPYNSDWWAKNQALAGDAKRQFQQIQEVYSVLSDASKKSMYDAGFYDSMEEDRDFCDFMQEMISMMNKVEDEPGNVEDLQKIFVNMVILVKFSLGLKSWSLLFPSPKA